MDYICRKISNRAYEARKEVTLIDIVYECVLNVHVTGIYTFDPFCRDLRILLRDFRGVGPNYYDITGGCMCGGVYRDPRNVLRNTAPYINIKSMRQLRSEQLKPTISTPMLLFVLLSL